MIRKLDSLRHNEIVALVKWTKAILRVSILTNWLGNWIAVTTVITYTAVSINTTTSAAAVPTAKIFAVISTIQLISEPLLMLGQSWGSLVGAWASFKRIEQFLQAPERQPRAPGRMSEVIMDKASFGVSGSVALIEEADIRVKPELWMIIGRVGSVGQVDFASWTSLKTGKERVASSLARGDGLAIGDSHYAAWDSRILRSRRMVEERLLGPRECRLRCCLRATVVP